MGSGGQCFLLSIMCCDTLKSSYKTIFVFLCRHPKRPCQMVPSQAALLHTCTFYFRNIFQSNRSQLHLFSPDLLQIFSCKVLYINQPTSLVSQNDSREDSFQDICEIKCTRWEKLRKYFKSLQDTVIRGKYHVLPLKL